MKQVLVDFGLVRFLQAHGDSEAYFTLLVILCAALIGGIRVARKLLSNRPQVAQMVTSAGILAVIILAGVVAFYDKGLEVPLRLYGYGLMMVLGFLTGITLGRWRARRFGENPDVVTNIGLLALAGGVVGARVAYVIEKWPIFTASPTPLKDMANITSGGLIYYGGAVGALIVLVVYLLVKRLPMRRYMDIIAPSLMTGLAFGRVGCLLNGCCYGAPVSENYPLAMRFPYASTPALKLDSKSNAFGGASVSPAFSEQVEPVVRELPANADESAVAAALTRHGLDQRASSVLGRAWQLGDFSALTPQEQNRARDALASLPTGSSRQAVSNALAAAGVDPVKASLAISPAGWVVRSPASLAGAEVDQALAVRAHALQPSQALGIANGLILAAILLAYSRLRRREGQVIALLLVMYPVTRFLLEMIRGDNPHNLLTLTFTHNQFTSMVMLAAGVIVFYVISRLPASAGAFWPDRVAAAGLVQSASPRKGNV